MDMDDSRVLHSLNLRKLHRNGSLGARAFAWHRVQVEVDERAFLSSIRLLELE